MKVLFKSEPPFLHAALAEGDSLDHLTASFVRNEVTSRVASAGVVILDFGPVRSIDSAGVGALVAMLKAVRSVNGRMALVGVKPSVFSVLEIIRLTTVFEIFPDSKTAAAALAPAAVPHES
jgi:anti-sigma B factor antagonist